MPDALSEASTVAAAPGQVSCTLDGEAVILSMSNGTYYGLDPVGARIWELVQQPQTVRHIEDAILAEYEVEPERCQRDVLALLGQLVAEGLVNVVPA